MREWISIKDKLPEIKKGVGEIANNSGLLEVKDNGDEWHGAYFENGNWLDAYFILDNPKCKYKNGLLNNVTHWRYPEDNSFLEPYLKDIPEKYRDRRFLVEE